MKTCLYALSVALPFALSSFAAAAQPAGGPCKWVSERTAEIGCWILRMIR